MRIRGVKFICDRCGKEEFYELNYEGEFKTECTFHIFDLKDDTYLCGECYQKYNQMVKEFMEGTKHDD